MMNDILAYIITCELYKHWLPRIGFNNYKSKLTDVLILILGSSYFPHCAAS